MMLRSLLEKMTGRLTGYLVGLVFTAVFLSLNESWTLGLRFYVCEALAVLREPSDVDPDITLVALDEGFAESYGYPELTPHDELAKVVRTVASHGPTVIGLDYKLLRVHRGQDGFEQLRQAVKDAGKVVLAGQVLTSKSKTYTSLPVPPPEEDFGRATQGFVNLWGEPVEAVPLVLSLEDRPGRRAPGFALVLAACHEGLATAGPDTVDWEELARRLGVPDSQQGRMEIDYLGPVRRKSELRVVAWENLERSPKDFFHGKVVLVGSTYREASGADTFETPIGTMRGAEVHADALHTLVTGSYLTRPGAGVAAGLVLLAFVLAGAAFQRLTLPRAVASTLGLFAVVYPLLCVYLFAAHRLVLPMGWPMKGGFTAVLLLYMLRESKWSRWSIYLRIRSYEDLALKVEPGDDPEIVRVTAAPGPGRPEEVTEQVLFRPGDPWGAVGTREQALSRWRRGDVDVDLLETLGERLFRLLFSGRLGEVYSLASRRAWSRLGGLRLRLEVTEPALVRLPWEYLRERSAGRFLALRPDVLFTRSVSGAAPRPAKLDAPALEVLVLLGADGMDVDWEAALFRHLETALREEQADVRCTLLDARDPEGLEALGERRFHVVHVVGPALPERWPDFAQLRLLVLDVSRPPVLAGPEEAGEWAVAKARAGVPAVLAVPVTMAGSSTVLFFRTVYREMAEGKGVEEAVAEGRRALYRREKARPGRDFGVPVLVVTEQQPQKGADPCMDPS